METSEIKYTLKTNNRSRRLKLSVGIAGNVVVTAPRYVEKSLIQNFINQKTNWILDKINYFSKYRMGKTFIQDSRSNYLQKKEQARSIAHQKVTEFNKFYNFKYGNISIKNQKTCWGSCSKKGNLNFNYKIAVLPEKLTDYIVVHELCHLGEFNHSKKFWNLMARVMPDFAERRAELKKVGVVLMSILLLFFISPISAFAQDTSPISSSTTGLNNSTSTDNSTTSTSTVSTASTSIEYVALSYEAGLVGGIERQWVVKTWWQQSNDLSQKIEALGSTTIPVIKIPILFGSDLKDLVPNFGTSRDHGARVHEGEDIVAVKGVPIISPTPSVVIRVGNGATEGNFVATANPGGEIFIYMHLDKIAEGLLVGSVLDEGSLIGYIGDTGNAIGGPVHLHFEIRNRDAIATDPYLRLKSEYSLQEKIALLNKVLKQSSDPTSLAQFMVLHFKSTFYNAIVQGIKLPEQITNALFSIKNNNTISDISTSTATTTSGTSTGVTVPPKRILNLYRNLGLRSRGEDVRSLQKFLNSTGFTISTYGIGSLGYETNYFGPATRDAVIKFQKAQGIFPSVGYVNAVTRGVIARILY